MLALTTALCVLLTSVLLLNFFPTFVSNIIDKLTLPEYFILKDMPSIGETLASRFIVEIGDVRRFKNKHSMISYAGIDAPPFPSGQFNADERHISKRGNKYLRKVGFEIMQSIIKYKPVGDTIYEFIEKMRSKGRYGKEAMIAGFNKLLRTYYGKVVELYSIA